MSFITNRRLGVAVLFAAAFVLSPAALFAAEIPAFQVEIGIEGDTQVLNPPGSDNGDGTFDFDGSMSQADWDFDWDITADPDPFISAVMGFTNNTAATQTFILNVSLPLAPPLAPGSFMGGSIGITVIDANFDGVGTMATDSPTAIYNGTLDGAPVLPLFSDPYSLSVPFAGGFAIDDASAGLPATIPGPAAAATIGISHRFTLTPGDRASFTSFFQAVDSDEGPIVPEPTTLALVAVSLVSVLGFRRRR